MNGTLKRKKRKVSVKRGKKAVFQHDGRELTKDAIVKTPFSEFGYILILYYIKGCCINHLRIFSLSLCSASDETADCPIHISLLLRCRGYTL